MPDHAFPKILVICDYYLPGYKSGGSMRTLANMVERLGDDHDFRIVTRDHDGRSDKTPYSNVNIDEWNAVGNASVKYLSARNVTIFEIRRSIAEVEPDAIYLNSYFSTLTVYVLLLRRKGLVRDIPVILAPEGELAETARNVKKTKKRLFLKLSAMLGLYRNIIWKTASNHEADDTERSKGAGGTVFIAPNMPPVVLFPEYRQDKKPEKTAGHTKLAFLSRIHPIKNLHFILELVAEIKGEVDLDVYGPIEDIGYFEKCREIANGLPSDVRVKFNGGLDNQLVSSTLFDSDFFILSTLGENFGHVFIEALAAGCPLIISDRTPWIGLEDQGIGWDIPLEERDRWIGIVQQCVDMDGEPYVEMSSNARNFAERWLADKEVENATRKVFEFSLESCKA